MIVGVDEDVDKVELPRVDWYVDGLEKRIERHERRHACEIYVDAPDVLLIKVHRYLKTLGVTKFVSGCL